MDTIKITCDSGFAGRGKVQVELPDIEISRTDIVGALTNYKRQSLPSGIEDIVDRLMNDFGLLLEPKLYCLTRRIKNIDKSKVVISEEISFKSPKLCKTLAYCPEILCFIVTIGGRLEQAISQAMGKGQFTEAYILDVIGSLAVENLVERFHQGLHHIYGRENKGVTLRFSPGYCDWHIKEQTKVFTLLEGHETGVKLTESFLMVPRKSVTGVIGLAELRDDVDVAGYNPCTECNKTDCPARRV